MYRGKRPLTEALLLFSLYDVWEGQGNNGRGTATLSFGVSIIWKSIIMVMASDLPRYLIILGLL